jgi:DNA-binding NarL/FixJ family response regulator
MSVKIILADDNEAIRLTHRCILETEPDFEVTGEACHGRELVQLVEQSQPDVVFMDISMPLMNGIEATRRLHQSHPEVKVVGLSSDETDATVLSMLQSGAIGYVLKPSSATELKQAIRIVLKGQFYLSTSLHRVLIDQILRMDKRHHSDFQDDIHVS